MLASLKRHWPEYLMEACELGLLAFMGCAASVLFQHHASPLSHYFEGYGFLRQLALGLTMGATLSGIAYSPMGKRSGAQLNPAVTFTFFRLGKIAAADAFFYVLFQFAGGIAGVMLAGLTLGSLLSAPEVKFSAAAPGLYGIQIGFLTEMLVCAVIMGTVLYVADHKRIVHKSGLYVGILYAFYITIEQPISGAALNPARSFGSGIMTGNWSTIWISFTAPLLGMLLAGEIFLWTKGKDAFHCAQLYHTTDVRQIISCGRTAMDDSFDLLDEDKASQPSDL